MHIPNWHETHRQAQTLAQKVADRVAGFVGSWSFLILHVIWFGGWIIFKVEPFPYGLLTMIVSLEAIILSTLIMMSQNTEVERDRHQALADYQTNVRAKEEIEDLQRALARIENEKLDQIISLLNKK